LLKRIEHLLHFTHYLFGCSLGVNGFGYRPPKDEVVGSGHYRLLRCGSPLLAVLRLA